MKIGIDARLWSQTGVGRYVRNLVFNLGKLDDKNKYVLFVNEQDYGNIKSQISNLKYQIFEIVKVNVRWHSLAEQLEFPKILNKYNLDLVHFPYFSVPVFYNKPYVVTVHDLILHHFPTGRASTLPLPIYGLKLLGYRFLIKSAARKSKRIITVSNATKKEIIDHLGIREEKIVVTYEGVAISNLKTQNSKLQLKTQKYFLYVGNAYPHKNLDRLLQAFSVLIHRYNNLSLILVGREDYFYKRLKEKVRKMGLSGSVIFKENVTDEELSSLYQNALALVQPSLMEGFGLPCLEAMASGCLILASDIAALREICGDSAIYFDPEDASDIEKKMEEAYSNDTHHYSEKIKKGVERAKMFSWEKMAKETLKVYENSIGI